ncbi:MAG: class III extradiol dioxygenase subunit B-like domain-containing protein [Candidatus Falkowbacteria bacterium]
MALIKTIVLPHSPLLIPEIGRANYSFLDKTANAYKQIGESLKELELDTLVIISPHGLSQDDAFTLNVSPEMSINLQDFGFIPPKTVLSGDSLLADQIKTGLKSASPLQLISEPILDYGSAIPAYLFKNIIGDFKIIVITPAENLSLEDHLNFGKLLQEIIKSSDKKIAVLASSDLSHRLKRKSPGGYSPKGAKFDNKLIEYLSEPTTAVTNILKMDSKLIKDAGECGLKPILILLGILDGTPSKARIFSYQTDFGIGYLSLEFEI